MEEQEQPKYKFAEVLDKMWGDKQITPIEIPIQDKDLQQAIKDNIVGSKGEAIYINAKPLFDAGAFNETMWDVWSSPEVEKVAEYVAQLHAEKLGEDPKDFPVNFYLPNSYFICTADPKKDDKTIAPIPPWSKSYKLLKELIPDFASEMQEPKVTSQEELTEKLLEEYKGEILNLKGLGVKTSQLEAAIENRDIRNAYKILSGIYFREVLKQELKIYGQIATEEEIRAVEADLDAINLKEQKDIFELMADTEGGVNFLRNKYGDVEDLIKSPPKEEEKEENTEEE